MLPLWQESLGNAGTTDVLEAARRYGTDGDEVVRAMAMTALRRVDSGDAIDVLARAATVDASPTVRKRATEALAENPAGASFETLANIAESDPDDGVRFAALTGLVRSAHNDPRARAFLERRAVEETSEDLREYIQQVLRS